MNPITALIRTYFVGRSRWVTDQLNCHWISGHQKRNGDCHNEIHSLIMSSVTIVPRLLVLGRVRGSHLAVCRQLCQRLRAC